jgi:predicted DNA binding CopG/RHH family protein
VPRKPKMLPHFESEQEEVEFWDTHDFEDYLEGPSDLIIRLKKRPTKTITMRMDEALYHDLRAVADRHEVPYQRLMQELLRKSLREFTAADQVPSRRKRSPTAQAAPATNP